MLLGTKAVKMNSVLVWLDVSNGMVPSEYHILLDTNPNQQANQRMGTPSRPCERLMAGYRSSHLERTVSGALEVSKPTVCARSLQESVKNCLKPHMGSAGSKGPKKNRKEDHDIHKNITKTTYVVLPLSMCGKPPVRLFCGCHMVFLPFVSFCWAIRTPCEFGVYVRSFQRLWSARKMCEDGWWQMTRPRGHGPRTWHAALTRLGQTS